MKHALDSSLLHHLRSVRMYSLHICVALLGQVLTSCGNEGDNPVPPEIGPSLPVFAEDYSEEIVPEKPVLGEPFIFRMIYTPLYSGTGRVVLTSINTEDSVFISSPVIDTLNFFSGNGASWDWNQSTQARSREFAEGNTDTVTWTLLQKKATRQDRTYTFFADILLDSVMVRDTLMFVHDYAKAYHPDTNLLNTIEMRFQVLFD